MIAEAVRHAHADWRMEPGTTAQHAADFARTQGSIARLIIYIQAPFPDITRHIVYPEPIAAQRI